MDPHSFYLLDPDPGPHSEKLLDLDPQKMNADPQPCVKFMYLTSIDYISPFIVRHGV